MTKRNIKALEMICYLAWCHSVANTGMICKALGIAREDFGEWAIEMEQRWQNDKA